MCFKEGGWFDKTAFRSRKGASRFRPCGGIGRRPFGKDDRETPWGAPGRFCIREGGAVSPGSHCYKEVIHVV